MQKIHDFLNAITMYRLVLYGLLFLVGESFLFSATGDLSLSITDLFLSLCVVVASAFAAQTILSKVTGWKTTLESPLITALILFLILEPTHAVRGLATFAAAGIIGIASKYILTFRQQHFFNPAALAAFAMMLFPDAAVTWWVGSAIFLPSVIILGLLVTQKLHRFPLLGAFLAASAISLGVFGIANQFHLIELYIQVLFSWPLIFFGTIMLTEPSTTPPTKRLQMLYGGIVGALFGAQFHFGILSATPQFALVVGNIFSLLVSQKQKLILTLQKKTELAPELFEFSFGCPTHFNFTAGQYLEWTVPHAHEDDRGVRRYFTIATSPTENKISIAVKIPSQPSTFKQALSALPIGGKVFAGQLAGDFTLPKDTSKKLVFIAGGIGITPFRSMAQWMVDTQTQRNVVLFYCCSAHTEFLYTDVFTKAQKYGLRQINSITHPEHAPKNWTGETGRITPELLRKNIPDFAERSFYVSGPNAMVLSYTKVLREVGVPRSQIIVDFFPGY